MTDDSKQRFQQILKVLKNNKKTPKKFHRFMYTRKNLIQLKYLEASVVLKVM